MGEKELVRKTFEGEVAFARLRNRLVHALIATVAATSPDWPQNETEVNGGGVNGEKKVLPELLEELVGLQRQFEQQALLMILMKLATSETGQDQVVVRFQEAVQRLIKSASAPADPSAGFWRNYVRLERIYNAVEVIKQVYFCLYCYDHSFGM